MTDQVKVEIMLGDLRSHDLYFPNEQEALSFITKYKHHSCYEPIITTVQRQEASSSSTDFDELKPWSYDW